MTHPPRPAPAARLWNGLRALVQTAGIALLMAPPAFMATLLLEPLWRWLETTTGLESVGHHGPATWCYLAVWLLAMAPWVAWFVRRRHRS